uniref:Very-long-chain 3-oxoacyl-CoA synthase n=1 Tax=Heterorhabditis bacteriophora TaxID=37862 RepID=A0A1I7WIK1_HETBA
MANFTVIPDEPIRMATAYYSNVLYTLGILALRLQLKRNQNYFYIIIL